MFDFAIVLNPETKDVLLNRIKQHLGQLKFKISEIKTKKDILLLIRMTDVDLILETLSKMKVEKIKYSKKGDKNQEAKYIQFKSAAQQLDSRITEMEKYSKFKHKDWQKFNKNRHDNKELFLEEAFEPWERELAVYQIIANILVDEQFRLLFDDKSTKQEYLFVYLKKKEILRDFCALPQKTPAALSTNIAKMANDIKYGFGEQVAVYFQFLWYLIRQMGILVIIGIATYILDLIFDEDVNTSPFETVYAMIVIVWGSYIVGRWKQKEQALRVTWRSKGKNFEHLSKYLNQTLIKSLQHDDHELFDHEQQLTLERNMLFTQQHLNDKDCDLDPVTGLKTPKRTHNQYLLYAKSFAKSLPYLIVLFTFLLISLNIRGYVPQEHGVIYLGWFARFSEEGALFDKNTNWANVTTVIHVLFVFFLNEKYREVSVESSLLERHEQFHDFEASLIIKRFAFEMLSGFLDFFYIGFIRFDIIALQSELLSMFTVDEVRRVIFETVIPMIQRIPLNKQAEQALLFIDNDTLQLTKKESGKSLLIQQIRSVYLPKYESFDDYLEVILNFGYLTFFTSAYPLAGVVIAFFLVVEFLSDFYKVNHLYQKPLSLKSKGIGPWSGTMDMICILSVFSNLILFAFASDKIAEIFPSLFVDPAHHHQQMLLMATPKKGAGKYIAIIVTGIEHMLFLGMYFLRKYLNRQKQWTDTYLARKAYKKTIS